MAVGSSFTFGTRLAGPIGPARERVTAALMAEGFGVLTEIDVAATLRAKLGVERPAYKILGACNPALAHRALSCDEKIGLLLPCNVVVYDAGGATAVAAMDPDLMSRLSYAPGLDEVVAEAGERLRRALGRVESAG
jgi:uncharacterized protein (DUF302 family)